MIHLNFKYCDDVLLNQMFSGKLKWPTKFDALC
jgi:hypothetical protein